MSIALRALPALPVRATMRAGDARDAVVRRVAASRNPVLIIVIAAAVVVGLGFIAYLQVQCMAHGYRAFNAVAAVTWHGAVNATVKFSCVK